MRKFWTVALREYRTNIKSKTFLIAMGIMPIFMFGTIIIQEFLEDRVDTAAKKIAVVDRTGKIFPTLLESAKEHNAKALDPESGEQSGPEYALERSEPPTANLDKHLLELSERVRAKELFAFVEIAPDAGATADSASAVRYFSNQPTYRDVYRWLRNELNGEFRAMRLREAGIDTAVVDEAMRPVHVENLGLLTADASGNIKQAEKVDTKATFMIPIIVMLLMWMCLVVIVQPMLNGILEEKMQRIAEVLLGSVPPFELLLGKLIGYVLVALTLVTVYIAGGLFIANHLGYLRLVPIHLIGWLLVFLTLAILMYGALFLAAGACCNDLREAQHLVMPIWIPMVVPILFAMTVIEHPSSTMAFTLSVCPFTGPMIMMIRMSVPPDVPLWQPLVSALVSIATALACVWVGGRIFRVGLLLQGKPPKITELLRWAVRG